MTTPWAHLPNAAHIDRVIASVKADPRNWGAFFREPWSENMKAVWLDTWRAAQRERNDVLTDAIMEVWTNKGPNQKGRGTIAVLVAYDDCAYMLDSDPGELAILAAFGDPRAIMLLPACRVFAKEKELA